MTDQPLNPRQEKFARLYYAGPDELRGNATRCYLEAYPESSYDAAASNAYRLLRHDGVRARMAELKEEAAEEAKLRARDWWEQVPDAQQTLQWAVTGNWPARFDGDAQAKRSALDAAKEILNRAEGLPRQMHEHGHEHQLVAVVAGPPHPVDAEEEGAVRSRSRVAFSGREN